MDGASYLDTQKQNKNGSTMHTEEEQMKEWMKKPLVLFEVKALKSDK